MSRGPLAAMGDRAGSLGTEAASGLVTCLVSAGEACADCVTELPGGFAVGFGAGAAEGACANGLCSGAGAGLAGVADWVSAGFAAAEFASAGFAGVGRSGAGEAGFAAAASGAAGIEFEATELAGQSELPCQT